MKDLHKNDYVKVNCQRVSIPTFYLHGIVGKILELPRRWPNYYGVEFLNGVPHGHSCNLQGKDGYCRWVDKKWLIKLGIIKMIGTNPNSDIIFRKDKNEVSTRR